MIVNHGAFDPTQMFATGRTPGSPSRFPRRTRMRPAAGMRPHTGEPHREQKARKLPGEDSYSERRSLPVVIRNSLSPTEAFVANAVPVARRHIEQWQ